MEKIEEFMEFLESWKMTVVGGVFLAASFVLMMSGADFPLDPAWITALICGLPMMFEAAEALFCRRKISSPLLISIAMVASICIGEVFAAGEIAFIMAVGEILEHMTVARAKRGIKNLVNLAPDTGRVIVGGAAKTVAVAEIKVGDTVRILPGETIPVDGKILSGNTSVDQSVVTGESIPVDKSAGDDVFCGTVNRFGAIDVSTSRAGGDSSLDKLVRLVREAEKNKSPSERIADKWASILVPAALLVGVAAYFATGDITRAVTVLVVFCPCALVLATPTSVMAAIGQATKFGVIIKSGAALETMGKVDCVAFDKTGTLTVGKPAVSDLFSETSQEELLGLAASAESMSEHPLGAAVVECAKSRGAEISEASDFKMTPGRGISANVGGRLAVCGNAAWLAENGIAIPRAALDKFELFSDEGKASIFVGAGGKFAGLVALSDTPRPAAKEVVSELDSLGVESVLLTGDNARAAEFFAKNAGLKRVFAGLLPAQKLEKIEALKASKKTVCMVGDGVNDAPALKSANVGVAMASMGSDIAVEAADIALMGDDITNIPYLKRLSNATVRSIKVNITLSMLINFAAVLLSLAAVLTPITGALVHNLGSVLVVLNAGLLYDRNLRRGHGAL